MGDLIQAQMDRRQLFGLLRDVTSPVDAQYSPSRGAATRL
jgi:hypothetical protein